MVANEPNVADMVVPAALPRQFISPRYHVSIFQILDTNSSICSMVLVSTLVNLIF